jgi:nucleoside-diphosphate-sugar epimerase
VIPTIITQIASGARSLRLGALHPTRDFSYVSDTVSGFIAAMNSDNTVGNVTNIGSGFEISIADTAALIADIMGVSIDIEHDEVRMRPELSEVDRLFASYAAATDRMGWVPSYGGREGFRRGLIQTIEWFKNPRNLEMYKPHMYAV